MLISKKELLEETGISYGQLYRWKRERLIPEDWFIKRPSFTGQETFFPRQKILQRIRAIQELKDKYSLEELSKILSPEVADRNFTIDDIALIEEIDGHLVAAFEQGLGKNNFTFVEVLLMAALTDCSRELNLSVGTVIDLTAGLKGYVDKIKSTGFILVVFDSGSEYYSTLYAEQADIFLDSRLQIAKTIRLNDLSSQIKLKYRKRFNFRFDEDEKELPEDGGLQFSY